MYEFQYTAEQMAVIAMRRAAEIRDAKLDYILKDMELDIRRRADRGETSLCLTGCPQYIIGAGHHHISQDPKQYSRDDYAHYFIERGYRTKVEHGERYLTWEPKPEPMDD